MSDRPHQALYQVSTTVTTRIVGWDPISAAIGISQTVFPAAHPGAVLLTRPDYFPEALAATRLLHRPFDGVLLYTEGERLEESVARELVRLSPHGLGLPGQVIVIGAVHAQILHDLAGLGFSVWQLIGHDLWNTIERLNEMAVEGTQQDALLVSVDPLAGGVVAGGYAAYAGTPLLFATEHGLLPCSVNYLRRHPKTHVYVVSPDSYLPGLLTNEVRLLGSKLEAWIGGGDAFELSVQFARYKHSKSHFGFGRPSGQSSSVTLVPYEQWSFAVAASSLSHRGRQTPLLLTKRDQLPLSVETYLSGSQAKHGGGGRSFPHGFLVGGLDVIQYPVQMRLHQALCREGG